MTFSFSGDRLRGFDRGHAPRAVNVERSAGPGRGRDGFIRPCLSSARSRSSSATH
jgi:hypothetical protein